jgi:hypothetical protein
MRIRNIELWGALLAIVAITALYMGVVWFSGVPAASGLLGHSIGILGFLLMLMTEILYSLRKRYTFARWGKLQHWLSFHIFTGLVGPYLVLLHSSWKFNGLAGVLMLMTVIIVISGFIGRYFYTAVPRSADGTLMEAEQLNVLIAQNQEQLERWRGDFPELVMQVDDLFSEASTKGFAFAGKAGIRNRWRELEREASSESRQLISNLRLLWDRQLVLKRQLDSMAGARRMLAIWHTVHVPLGVALFTVAFIHILGALYYATFLH